MRRSTPMVAPPMVALLAAALLGACGGPEPVAHGRFPQVEVYVPRQPPSRVLLWLSGDEGWQAGEREQARALARQGVMVAGIDSPLLLERLLADPGDCLFLGGDLDNLSRYVQAAAELPYYLPPTLAGSGRGAALVQGALHQLPADSLAGAVLNNGADCAIPTLPRAICGMDTPPTAVALCTQQPLSQALTALPPVPIPPISPLSDLPLVEQQASVPSTPETAELFAVFWSGDGGWAGFDRELADALNRLGVPVVGVDSLRYFWEARDPQQVADDTARILAHYRGSWRRNKALLIGFSQGANVLPLAYQQLPDAQRSAVAGLMLLSPERTAKFEFHLHHWLRLGGGDGIPLAPTLAELRGQVPLLCVHGERDRGSVCAELPASEVLTLPGGHHLDGRKGALAQSLLQRLAVPG